MKSSPESSVFPGLANFSFAPTENIVSCPEPEVKSHPFAVSLLTQYEEIWL